MKKLICIVLVSLLVLCGSGAAFAETAKINAEMNSVPVVLDGVRLDMPTMLYDGRVYVPLAETCKYFNQGYYIDEITNTIHIVPLKNIISTGDALQGTTSKESGEITVLKNPYPVWYEGINTYIDTILYKNVVYVPVRYLVELFDKNVAWDPKEKAVAISDISKEIVGTVNGESITKREFDYYLKPNEQSIRANAPSGESGVEEELKEFKQTLFDNLVVRKIALQKARQAKMVVLPADVTYINSVLDDITNNYGGIANFRKVLDGYGIVLPQIVNYYKESTLLNKIREKSIAGVTASEDKLKQYYEENKANYLTPETVQAKHILISTRDESGADLSPEKKEEAKAKAQDILNRIKAGEDFDKLMNEFSQDPGLQTNPDGYTFGRGEMVTEFEDASFAMEPGQVSELVESTYGYHIIKLVEKTPEKQQTYEETREQIKPVMDNQEQTAYYQALLDQWKAESKTEKLMEQKPVDNIAPTDGEGGTK